jgi:hypothetical protein
MTEVSILWAKSEQSAAMPVGGSGGGGGGAGGSKFSYDSPY